jgi:hypothetical protein
MRFRGLSEPLVARVCSAAVFERHVGGGFLGPIRLDDPLVEMLGVALSDDEQTLMVHVHAATETKKFVSTAEVNVRWYERQFENNIVLRGTPDDARAIGTTPCQFFEIQDEKPEKTPSIVERVKRGEVGFARELAARWFKGGRPIRKTEQLFLALLNHEKEDIRENAKAGLLLLVEALSGPSIPPSIKHKIGEICVVVGRLDPPPSGSRTTS